MRPILQLTFTYLFLAWQAFLRGQSALPAYELSQLSDISGSMAQEAILLEREVTNYWLAHFFQAEKSKRKDRSWEALLLMWLRTVSQSSSSSSRYSVQLSFHTFSFICNKLYILLHYIRGIKLSLLAFLCPMTVDLPIESAQRIHV